MTKVARTMAVPVSTNSYYGKVIPLVKNVWRGSCKRWAYKQWLKESTKPRLILNKHSKPVAENHLNRNFTPDKPNVSWVADITYIWTKEGWLYLVTIMDLYSRKIIGWSLRNKLTKGLVISALHMALKQRKLSSDLLLHSDRGSQYASKLYQLHLVKHGILCSMSGKGNCLR